MARVYTKTGDDGTTTLGKQKKIPKSDIRLHVCGTLDELSSLLGVLRSYDDIPEGMQKTIIRIQETLLLCGSMIHQANVQSITSQHVQQLEQDIDAIEATLPFLDTFILPGSNTAEATCHLARTVCRRAEREIATSIAKGANPTEALLAYMNRLSDLLFVMARKLR